VFYPPPTPPTPPHHLPSSHPPPHYACPEISAHLKKSAQKPRKPAFMDFKVRCTIANDLVHTYIDGINTGLDINSS